MYCESPSSSGLVATPVVVMTVGQSYEKLTVVLQLWVRHELGKVDSRFLSV